jgi:lipopolysaccharide transport system ATP-binding protein
MPEPQAMGNRPIAVSIQNLGKMYKLYRKPTDKILDALKLQRLFFWRKYAYQEFWALRDLNLEIKRGERLGIVGRNGAGKSTLLKIMSGNVTPTEGTVIVNGMVQALMELGTGFHPEFTGRANIRASLAYQGVAGADVFLKEQEIIDFAELGDFIDQPIKTYSAGMYARLAFSTATSVQPDILIIDEVLGAGDAYFAAKCLQRMKTLTEDSGATVLFVSHDLASVQQICTRAIWIERGRILQDGTPFEVTKTYYASILEQETVRLQTRNARKNHIAPEAAKPATVELTGRFVIHGGQAPVNAHAIRSIMLMNGMGWSLMVEPGTPMDNDASQPAYLYTDPKYMYWSAPRLFQGIRVRCIEDTGGQYHHAPFVFVIPEKQGSLGQLRLQVQHSAQSGEQVEIELLLNDTYVPLGTLTESPEQWCTESWLVDTAEPLVQPELSTPTDVRTVEDRAPNHPVILRKKSSDKYLSDYSDLLDVFFSDAQGRPTVIFGADDSIGVSASARISLSIPTCEFVVSIYTLNGTVVANLHWPIANGLEIGQHTWQMRIPEPHLRQGEYMVSVALILNFEILNNETIVFYSLWDRALAFRVDEGYVGQTPLGMVVMPTLPPVGTSLATTRTRS